MANALLRDMPDTFDRAIVRAAGTLIDVDLAKAQHALYSQLLGEAGYEIEQVPADPACPDCVFVEDMAVIVGGVAVVTRPGAPTRRREVGPVADTLSHHFPLVTLEAPATLDGGDVMVLGDTVYVGRSERTNDVGISQIESVVVDQNMGLVKVDVVNVLHLKSAVLPIAVDTVVVTPRAVDESGLADLHVLHEAEEERNQFSALPLEDDRVLVTASSPRTSASVSDLGIDVVPIDVSQILLADGGLTCLSILW